MNPTEAPLNPLHGQQPPSPEAPTKGSGLNVQNEGKVVSFNGREVQALDSKQAVKQAQAQAIATVFDSTNRTLDSVDDYSKQSLGAIEKTIKQVEAQVGGVSKNALKQAESANSMDDLEKALMLMCKANEMLPQTAVKGNSQILNLIDDQAKVDISRQDVVRQGTIENVRKINGAVNEAALNEIAQEHQKTLNAIDEEKGRQAKDLDRLRKELELVIDKDKATDDLKSMTLKRRIALHEQAEKEYKTQVDLYKEEFKAFMEKLGPNDTFTATEPKLIWKDEVTFEVKKGTLHIRRG